MPVADVFDCQTEFMRVVFQHRLEKLTRRLTELFVNLPVPLVNPRQQFVQPRQEGREPSGVVAFPNFVVSPLTAH